MLYEFKRENGTVSSCDIFFFGDNSDIVVCCNFRDSKDVSMGLTINDTEFLANLICEDFGINKEDVTWIERLECEESIRFVYVNFNFVGQVLCDPNWIDINQDDLREYGVTRTVFD